MMTVYFSAVAASSQGAEREAPPAVPMAHMVFFDLKDDSPPSRENLVEGCKKHLSGHRGALHFSVGVLAADYRREVNDLDFDVALHLVFRDKAAHDEYQEHPRHKQFVEECKHLWKRVRVFDSYLVAGGAAPDGREGGR